MGIRQGSHAIEPADAYTLFQIYGVSDVGVPDDKVVK